jgi:hypothetical protein
VGGRRRGLGESEQHQHDEPTRTDPNRRSIAFPFTTTQKVSRAPGAARGRRRAVLRSRSRVCRPRAVRMVARFRPSSAVARVRRATLRLVERGADVPGFPASGRRAEDAR